MVSQGASAVVVQHVYRPDNSPQQLRVGEEMPLHATASGKVLLAHQERGILEPPQSPPNPHWG